jgi:ABC-type uncharacterized transport system substrate-binding protein
MLFIYQMVKKSKLKLIYMPKKILLVLFSFLYLSCLEAKELTYKVYIIHSYLPGLWSEQAHNGVSQALKFHNIKNFEIKQYDYDYVRQRKVKEHHLKNILHEINAFSPDLIIVFDDEATEDFIPKLNLLKIPIVVTGINKEISKQKWFLNDGDQNRNFTGILERYPFEGPLKLLKKIRPEINRISILTSDNDSSRIITNQVLENFKQYNNLFSGIRLGEVIRSRDWTEWKKAIQSKKNKNEAFWILVPWDVYHENKEVSIKEIGTYYQKESSIPELGIVNASQLFGMLLCFSVNSEDLAFEAVSVGVMARKENKSLRDIPFAKVNSVRVVINKERADQLKFNIPSELLDFAKIEKKIPLDYLR